MELTIMFFASMFLAFFIFFYYAKKDTKRKKEKTLYIPIEKIDEENDGELPIIRY